MFLLLDELFFMELNLSREDSVFLLGVLIWLVWDFFLEFGKRYYNVFDYVVLKYEVLNSNF